MRAVMCCTCSPRPDTLWSLLAGTVADLVLAALVVLEHALPDGHEYLHQSDTTGAQNRILGAKAGED